MTVIYAGVLLSAGTSGAQTTGGTTGGTTDDTTRDRIGGTAADTAGATQYTTQYNTQYAAQARNSQSDEGCSNPQVVETFTGTENQITDSFEITGNTFRLSYDITGINNDPAFDSFLIRALDEDGLQAGDSVLVFDEGSDAVNILEGPGTFTLEIESDGFDYAVTVEDCTGTNGGNGGGGGGGGNGDNGGGGGNVGITERRNGDVIINVPEKPLPPTGGLPVSLMVGGFVLAGAGLLAWSFAAQRGRQR